MTSNGHQNGQYYSDDPRFMRVDMDGHAQSYTQGNMAGTEYGASHPQNHSQQVQGGYGYQHYGQAAQYVQQRQQNAGTQQGYAEYAGVFQQGYAPQQGYRQSYNGQPNHGQTDQAYPGQPRGMQGMYVAPTTSQPVKLKKKSRKPIIIALVVALICVALAIAIFFMIQQPASTRAGERGQLEGKTEEEIQAELDRQVEEGMFNISIASVVEFADGASEGEFRIENVPGNNYLMQVAVNRDDTGETVYETGMIEPDYHIQRDTLSVDLDQGTYPCTAIFTAYDPETETQIGQAAAKITLLVKG